MGTDYLIRINDDGSTTLLNDTRYYIKNFGDISIQYWIGPAPGPGQLSIKGKVGNEIAGKSGPALLA